MASAGIAVEASKLALLYAGGTGILIQSLAPEHHPHQVTILGPHGSWRTRLKSCPRATVPKRAVHEAAWDRADSYEELQITLRSSLFSHSS